MQQKYAQTFKSQPPGIQQGILPFQQPIQGQISQSGFQQPIQQFPQQNLTKVPSQQIIQPQIQVAQKQYVTPIENVKEKGNQEINDLVRQLKENRDIILQLQQSCDSWKNKAITEEQYNIQLRNHVLGLEEKLRSLENGGIQFQQVLQQHQQLITEQNQQIQNLNEATIKFEEAVFVRNQLRQTENDLRKAKQEKLFQNKYINQLAEENNVKTQEISKLKDQITNLEAQALIGTQPVIQNYQPQTYQPQNYQPQNQSYFDQIQNFQPIQPYYNSQENSKISKRSSYNPQASNFKKI